MLNNLHNPDVLNCLANLSNDEVFTPPNIANQMLDTLPKELWQNKNAKFLDPFCKSGVFLREIAKRLIKGLETQIPNLQERVNHIMQHQLYGIGITELTVLLSRRSLYCNKNPQSKHSVAQIFPDERGNIAFDAIAHTWENGKCRYCGVRETLMDEEERKDLEAHAYQFIHNKNPFKNMQFDVIIGNPPYQLSDGGGTGDSAKPIYHLFIEQAIKMKPHYLCMIVPSRWMKGGKGLNSFRENMMNDTRLKHLYDYENAKEIFSGINLDGGVCYFLWDKEYNGECEFYHKTNENEEIYSKRYLKTNLSDKIIRDYRQLSIIQKSISRKENKFSDIVSSRNPYGFNSDFFNRPKEYPNVTRSKTEKESFCKIYGVRGNKGGSKRIFEFIDKKSIIKNRKNINKFKLFFSKAYTTTATVPPEIILGNPNEICTETFLEIGTFINEKQNLNCLSYIKTKFFRALLFFYRHSLNISQDSFELIPLQNFDEEWTDEKLYKKYNLTKEEINYIESMIRPME